jgi:hypothetical protein
VTRREVIPRTERTRVGVAWGDTPGTSEKEAEMGMTPTIDVLLDARSLLARTDGWIQRSRSQMVKGKIAYCIEGALLAAEPKSHPFSDGSSFSDAWTRVQAELDEPIAEYNDAPERQQSEVVETIDRAIQAEWRGGPIPRSPLPWRSGALDHFEATSIVLPHDAA